MGHIDTSYRDRTWTPQPKAEAFVRGLLDRALAGNPEAAKFAEGLLENCAVRLRDLLDHLVVDAATIAEAEAHGWAQGEHGAWHQPLGLFPPLVKGTAPTVWFRVENAEDFVRATGAGAAVEGQEHGPVRRVLAFPATGSGYAFGAIARQGYVGFDMPVFEDGLIRAARLHLQNFRARRRQFDTVDLGLEHTEKLVDAAVADLGQHWACAIWLKAEREYWMSRCPAGRLQKALQDAVGIGWSNIDHHTYDGSRRYFRHTIRILEKLGYELREMLYAGHMAGWGSQVLEQPVLGSTIFADVDLAPEELDIDFAHVVLPELEKHRRAGILSILHGESILEGGLNHVAGLYDQKALRALLGRRGLKMMQPFSNFPFLYQELTEGDWAPVEPSRVDALEKGGHLTAKEAEDIRLNGYIAAHLENIERNDGYKGFNKPGIDGVLRALDPRAAVRGTAQAQDAAKDAAE